jgi:hypothetical protein
MARLAGEQPPPMDIFSAMGPASPLITHAMPWGAVGFSLAAGIVFLLAASRVVQMRQY